MTTTFTTEFSSVDNFKAVVAGEIYAKHDVIDSVLALKDHVLEEKVGTATIEILQKLDKAVTLEEVYAIRKSYITEIANTIFE